MPAIATIYEHSNYSGRTLQLQGVGDYDYSTLASYSFNDLTSSIKLESGYYLQAFADAGFKGASAIFTGSTSYVGNGFNDKISSLRLVRGTPNSSSTIDLSNYGAAYRQPSATIDLSNYGAAYRQPSATTALATLYEHANYGGRPLQLTRVGDYDYATLGARSFNDLISSIKLESGYYLQAYTDAGFKGASAIFTGSTSYVGNGFNDKISSLRLVRGTPNVSTLDYSNYGAAYRQPLSQNLLQGIWNNGAFVLEVAWKDPITGADVKKESIASGRGSHMLRGPNESAFAVEISAQGTWMADIALELLLPIATAGISAWIGDLTTHAAKAAKLFLNGVDGAQGVASLFTELIPGFDWTLNVAGWHPAFESGRYIDVSRNLYDPILSLGGPLPASGSFTQVSHDTKQKIDMLTGTGHNNLLAPSWAIPRSPAPDTSKMIKVNHETKKNMDELIGKGNHNFHTPFHLIPSTKFDEPPSPVSPINAGTNIKQMMDRLTGAGNNNFI
jgi:hypothetical protein